MLSKVYKKRVWIILVIFVPFFGYAQPAGWDFTLNPTWATYTVTTGVAFNGVDALSPGDWIGVFYEDADELYCAGYVQWSGSETIAITAFGNDEYEPEKNGFADGELIQWKFYYQANQLEVCVKAFDQGGEEFNWDNGYLGEVLSFNTCEILEFTIEIPLYAEYQFVSSPIVTDNMNMLSVIDDVLSTIDFVRTNDGKEVFFVPFPPPGNWVNGIGDWISNDGYYFNNTSYNNSLVMTGSLAEQTPIDLPVGYRFVGYPLNQPQNALDAFSSILNDIEFIRTNQGKEIFFVPFPPPGNWVNGIGDCEPGDGYYIQVKNPITGFVFPEP